MKKLITFLLIGIIGFLLTLIGPWYLIALAGFCGGLLLKNQWSGLLIGFLAGFILWAIHIGFLTGASESDLPTRMAQLFTLPSDTALILISALIGGTITGLAAAAGTSFAKAIKR
nr:hypothetical protein [Allomuricauda sp.]